MSRGALREEYRVLEPSGDLIDDNGHDRGRREPVDPDDARVGLWSRVGWKRAVQLAVLLAIALGVYRYVSAPADVAYVPVRTVTTTETLGATGKVRGERVADLGIDVGGVIRTINVAEGDVVRPGSLLLSVDKVAMDARVRGAQAAVDTAMAELGKASQGPLPSEIRRAQAELSQARDVGQARVAQSEARLRNLKAGTRTNEIASANAELQSKKDLLAKAEKDYQRVASLVAQGALAQANLDSARTDVSTAQSAVAAQQARVNLLREGATTDQLAEARASVTEAKATRDTATRAAREVLNSLLAIPRPEDVRAARARVEEARAELTRAMDERSKTDLRAPFSGVVADIPVEQGQSVSPGQKLIVLHEMSNPGIEVETDEETLSSLSLGQRAVVTADAFPGKSFDATLTDLGSMVNPERGTIRIKLKPVEAVDWLRPDLTVDVNIVTQRAVRRIILPADTLAKHRGNTVVFAIRDSMAVPVRVTTGASGPKGIVVEGKLNEGELVARNAKSVAPNSRVNLVGGGRAG